MHLLFSILSLEKIKGVTHADIFVSTSLVLLDTCFTFTLKEVHKMIQ